MHRPVTTRCLLIIAGTLATLGCAPDPARWSEDEAPKENTVQLVTLSHTVHFRPGAATLSSEQAQAFQQFAAASIHLGDHVAIELDQPEPIAQAALTSRREAAITRLLAKLSIEPSFAVVQVSGLLQMHNDAVFRVSRYIVTPPHCPDWTKSDGDDITNTPSSNFGCATTTNIGLMVADPADLVRGTAAGSADGIFAARAVDFYRAGGLAKSLAGASGPGAQQGGGSGSGGGN